MKACVGLYLGWVWSVWEGGGLQSQVDGGPVSKDLVYNMFTHYFVESAHCKHWE